MAKDPAFLFYDGDAARDVSHMNRLERGAYFDLIQAQRKFGGYTMEQARKILGKDFEEVWPALELILTMDENSKYFIEWVRTSMVKRIEHAEKQRKRIQDYWDEKKKEDIPRNNHGITTDIPLVNENENEIVNNKKKRSKKIFVPPTIDEMIIYFRDNGYNEAHALKVFKYYSEGDWHDSNGNQVNNWKQKCQANWFKNENRINGEQRKKVMP